MILFRFLCGHIGRENEPGYNGRAKVRAFIRVAEIRDRPVDDVRENCPDCAS
jgi:hypothetical protein